jgi:molybdopterin converting factor small subunit
MAVKIVIPTPLRQYTGHKDSVEVGAATVGEALNGLASQYSDLRKHLYTEEGNLRSFVNIYLNDEDIRFLSKEQTPVRENDTISIVPSIAGGSGCPCICS